MPIREIALIAACILLGLAAFGVASRVGLGWLGLALWCATELLRVGG